MISTASSPTTSKGCSEPKKHKPRSPFAMFSRRPRPWFASFLMSLASLWLAVSTTRAQSEPSGLVMPTYTLAGTDIFGNTKTPDSVILGILNIPEGAEIDPQIVTALDEKLRASGKFAYSRVSSTAYGDLKTYLT